MTMDEAGIMSRCHASTSLRLAASAVARRRYAYVSSRRARQTASVEPTYLEVLVTAWARKSRRSAPRVRGGSHVPDERTMDRPTEERT